MANSADFRAAIPKIIEKCASIEDLRAALAGLGDLASADREPSELYSEAWISLVLDAYKIIFRKLGDVGQWTALAKSPKEFNFELEHLMKKIRTLMRSMYSVPSKPHRPAKNVQRDTKIFALKTEHPTWGWQRIGDELDLGPNGGDVAERAFKRMKEGKRNELKSFLEQWATMLDELERPKRIPTA